MLPLRFGFYARVVALFSFCLFAQAQVSLTNVKFDVLSSLNAGTASLTSTAFDIGTVKDIFDGNTNSLARTPNINPGYVQVSYTTARTLRKFRVYLSYGSSYQWRVEKADTQADMDSKTGSWQTITPIKSMNSWTWSEVALAQPVNAKIFRLWVTRFGGDGYCHINEWELYGDVVINQVDLTPTNSIVAYVGDTRQFQTIGRNTTLNETYNISSNVTFNASGGIGTISQAGLFTATNAGFGTITALVSTLSSKAVAVTILAPNLLSDIDVFYIERTPRLAFNPSDTTYSTGLPINGQQVIYLAHVKNWGTNAAIVPYEWRFDGGTTNSGSVTIDAGKEVTIPFSWAWESVNHDLEFVADPSNSLREASKLNNRRKIRTNALLVGLWVEQGLWSYMHNNQLKLNDGANSFEDWGQRMVDRWNEMMSKAKFPWAPEGFLDQLSLDKVVVVPDGALPLAGGLAGNNPDSRDQTVDMQWGYPWNPKSVENGEFYMFRWNGPFFIDFGSIHEMNHARYHVDLYALDENHNANAQNVLLYTDGGQLIPGSSYMPFIAWDVVYYNKWRDIMGAGSPIFDGYSPGAWNWKHHKRGQGNQNAPPDIGRFLNDLPTTNIFQFIDQTGAPLDGAEVWYYRANGGFYTKQFDNTPEGHFFANTSGEVILPRNPFGGTLPLGGFGPACPDIIFKVRYAGEDYYMFQEVTDFNINFWMGRRDTARYIREIDLRTKPVAIPQGQFLGNYFNFDLHESTPVTRQDPSINFAWTDSPIAGVGAENFGVYWHGGIKFAEGWKEFTITSDGGIQIYIDGRLVFDQSTNQIFQTWKPIIYTAASAPFVNPGKSAANGDYHRMEVRYTHRTGPAEVRVSWTDETPAAPVPVNGWRADYYTTKTFNGYMVSRLEAGIDYDYQGGSPDPAVPADNFSARWTGDWFFNKGTYQFTAITDDGMRVYIDGALALNQWFDQPPTTYKFTKTFTTAGIQRVKVEYYEGAVTARAFFGWTQAPLITTQPTNIVAKVGDTVSLGVGAIADPTPAFQWMFNKTAIPGATDSVLTLTNIQPSNAGIYFVTVTNAAGTAISKTASLTVVQNPPHFDAAQWVPESASIRLVLSGDKNLTYQIKASTDLVNWQTLGNVVNTTGSIEFSDPAVEGVRYRFYKVAILP